MSLLVRNVKILGAPKGTMERGDIYISGTRISAVGDLAGKKALEVVEGQGDWIVPGFVDVETLADRFLTLFETENTARIVAQGITAAVGGHCGISLAPLGSGTLEPFAPFTDIRRLHPDWSSIPELFIRLRKSGVPFHFGTFVGYGALRTQLFGPRKEFGPAELAAMDAILRQALRDGALGVSLALEASCSPKEIEMITNLVRENEGILGVHMPALGTDEMRTLARLASKVPKLFLTHALSPDARAKDVEEVAARIDHLSHATEVRASIAPIPQRVFCVRELLPPHLREVTAGEFSKLLRDDWSRRKLLRELPEISHGELTILHSPLNHLLRDVPFSEFLAHHGTEDTREGITLFMRQSRLKGMLLRRGSYPRAAAPLLQHPNVFVGSHTPYPLDRNNQFLSAFRTLTRGGMTLNDAALKLSRDPAQWFGFREIGEIKEGYRGDLVLLRADHIRAVIIGGELRFKA